MFRTASPRGRAVKIGALLGILVGVLLVAAFVVIRLDYSYFTGSVASAIGTAIGLVVALLLSAGVLCGFGAILGFMVAAFFSLPGQKELAEIAVVRGRAGWYPDPVNPALQPGQ